MTSWKNNYAKSQKLKILKFQADEKIAKHFTKELYDRNIVQFCTKVCTQYNVHIMCSMDNKIISIQDTVSDYLWYKKNDIYSLCYKLELVRIWTPFVHASPDNSQNWIN